MPAQKTHLLMESMFRESYSTWWDIDGRLMVWNGRLSVDVDVATCYWEGSNSFKVLNRVRLSGLVTAEPEPCEGGLSFALKYKQAEEIHRIKVVSSELDIAREWRPLPFTIIVHGCLARMGQGLIVRAGHMTIASVHHSFT